MSCEISIPVGRQVLYTGGGAREVFDPDERTADYGTYVRYNSQFPARIRDRFLLLSFVALTRLARRIRGVR